MRSVLSFITNINCVDYGLLIRSCFTKVIWSNYNSEYILFNHTYKQLKTTRKLTWKQIKNQFWSASTRKSTETDKKLDIKWSCWKNHSRPTILLEFLTGVFALYKLTLSSNCSLRRGLIRVNQINFISIKLYTLLSYCNSKWILWILFCWAAGNSSEALLFNSISFIAYKLYILVKGAHQNLVRKVGK